MHQLQYLQHLPVYLDFPICFELYCPALPVSDQTPGGIHLLRMVKGSEAFISAAHKEI